MSIERPSTTSIASPSGPWKAGAGAYLAKVHRRTGSTRTPQEYAGYLERFLSGIDAPAQATPAQFHAFAYGPGVSGKLPSSSTVGVRLAALRDFYDFVRQMRLVDRNPADEVKRPKAQEPTPQGLSADEFQLLLAAVLKTPAGARDKALIITAVLTGLCRAELLALRAGNLERCAGAVYYHVRTKGGQQRHRELPAPAYAAIVTALRLQGTLPEAAPLFAISSHGFYKNLKHYAKRAGLKDVTPHTLRHSAAKLRRDTGASIEVVGSFLGHRQRPSSRDHAHLPVEHDSGSSWCASSDALGINRSL